MPPPAAIVAAIFLPLALAAAAKAPAKPAEKPPRIPVEELREKFSAYGAREALAKLQAMDIFPEMEKEDSNFSRAVSTEVECLECEEPSFFKSPAWPLQAARRVAGRLGVMPRTVREIRAHLARTFDLDTEAFLQIHGIQFVSAHLTAGGEVIDVAPQLAARVGIEGCTVDCDGALVAALTEERQVERHPDEKRADYWKRQRALLAAVAEARPGEESLQIRFEFHSETVTAEAKSGERLSISCEGIVSVAKIAPAAREVRVPTAVATRSKVTVPGGKSAAKKPPSVRDLKR